MKGLSFTIQNMYPILIKIPIFDGFTIFYYGALVAFGFLAGIFYITKEAKRLGEDTSKILDLVFWVIVSAIIGSRIYYVLTSEPGLILDDPLSFFKIWRGGLVFQGGVLGALIVGTWWVIRHKLPLWKYMDIFAPAIALGHFFGRIGCFMSGCCHGRPASHESWYTITFPADPSSFAPPGLPLYPTQFMEAGGELLIFIGLFFFIKKKKFDSQIMSLYLISYAILRFVVEFFRDTGNRTILFWTFSVAQLVSLVLIVFAVWMWVRNSKKEIGKSL